ncbi:MAG: TrkA C-terminal domain-containing protein [Planctomycetes bacterium]|nr:TrkA C-terminal domain-containing protein [Planctomycetota bacterium]
MSVMLFIIVLVASFVIVRVGAIAFQLTGLEWSLAKFQALSCFSGTGFTTREAELVTGHEHRRRIASVLMVLGNAGLVTLIATAASALNPKNTMLGWLSESYLPFLPTPMVLWVNLVLITLAAFVVSKLFSNIKFMRSLTNYLRKKIIGRAFFKPVCFEEMSVFPDGYSLTRIRVDNGSPLAGKSLAESVLKQSGIRIVALIADDQTLPDPDGQTPIKPGQELIAFGKSNAIRSMVS